MIIRITYPSIYNVDIRELNNAKRNSVSEGKKMIDEYIVDSIEKITLHIVLNNRKEHYKFWFFKKGWLHPFISIISCDTKLDEQIIALAFKSHQNSELELFLETDYVMNSANSYTDKLKLNVNKTKAVCIKDIITSPVDKRSLVLLVCILSLIVLSNILLPLLLAISMIYCYFYQPDLLWGIEEQYLLFAFAIFVWLFVYVIKSFSNVRKSVNFYKSD